MLPRRSARCTLRTVTADSLPPLLDAHSIFLLDVREPDEFEEWRIPGAVNIPLGSLASRVAELPAATEIVTVCASGTRAASAVEVLAHAGVAASVLEGGMGAWANTYDDVAVTVGGATVLQVRRLGKGCLSYLVAAGDAAVVIDPSADVDQYLDRAAARGWRLTHVFDTHLHADHLSGARALAAASGATLVLNPADHFEFVFEPLEDGMHIAIADGVEITVSVLSAPGHTRGSTAFLLGDDAIFTGDTLFLESVGRPDLADRAEEFARELFHTLHDKVLSLPDGALVLPAHFGAAVEVRYGSVVAATLGALRGSLWQLGADEEKFVAWAAGAASPRPPNYEAIVVANQRGAALDEDERRGLEEGPNHCAVAS